MMNQTRIYFYCFIPKFFASYSKPRYLLSLYQQEKANYGIIESKFLKNKNKLICKESSPLIKLFEKANALLEFNVQPTFINIEREISAEFIKKFKELQQDIKNQLKQQSQDQFFQIVSLVNELNIINLNIWQEIIIFFTKYLDNYVYENINNQQKQLEDFLNAFIRYSNIFAIQNKRNYASLFMFEEQEFKYILNKEQIILIYEKLSIALNKIVYSQINAESIFSIVYKFTLIIEKFLKISYVNIHPQKSFIQNYVVPLAKFNLPLYKLIIIKELCSRTLYFDPKFSQSLDEKILSQFKDFVSIQPINIDHLNNIIACIIREGAIQGQIDKNLLEFLKPYLINYIKTQKKIEITQLTFKLLTAEIYDNEILELLLTQIKNSVPVNTLTKLQTKVTYINLAIIIQQLHVSFKLIQVRHKQFNLENYQDYLTYFQQKDQNASFIQLIPKKSPQEQRIIVALKSYFNQNVSEEFNIIVDQQVCEYLIDCALYLKDHKIAIEISGHIYCFSDGRVKGKKKNKFEILKDEGWKVIIFKTFPNKIQNKLSFNSESLDLISSIIKQIEEEIGRPLAKKSNVQIQGTKAFAGYKKKNI